MAIFFPEQNAILLLPPKTGSKWVGLALRTAGIPHQVVGPLEWRDHGTLQVHGRAYDFIGSFVRNPVDWYQSYWSYRTKRGWNAAHALDRVCQDPEFKQFVRKAAGRLPGIVTTMFESYVGPVESEIDFVGHQEQLADDLDSALIRAGVPKPGRWNRERRVNQSGPPPPCSDDLRELICFSELEAVRRFGYLGTLPDRPRLFELLQRYPDHLVPLRSLAMWTEVTHWKPDDTRAAAGRPRATGTRYARLMGNFALYLWSVLDDLELATEYFRGALEHDPEHPRTLGNFAVFNQVVLHDRNGAQALFDRALAVRPEHAYNLGNYAYFVERELGDHTKARQLYEKALKLEENLPRNLANYAGCLSKIDGMSERARQYFARALEQEPQARRVWLQYGEFLEAVGENDGARDAYRTALQGEAP